MSGIPPDNGTEQNLVIIPINPNITEPATSVPLNHTPQSTPPLNTAFCTNVKIDPDKCVGNLQKAELTMDKDTYLKQNNIQMPLPRACRTMPSPGEKAAPSFNGSSVTLDQFFRHIHNLAVKSSGPLNTT
ncbi:hypothetical protein BDQ17DRAFT_1332924 [Cyathus striatus]|nr:hypothetical protein BDQ17DRAFT_1332924 [Cyathus striatus]